MLARLFDPGPKLPISIDSTSASVWKTIRCADIDPVVWLPRRYRAGQARPLTSENQAGLAAEQGQT